MPDRRKFLCVCNGGVVRSVTLAAMLKYWWNLDAMAASIDKNVGDTMTMLCNWADVIVVMDGWMLGWFQEQYGNTSFSEQVMSKLKLVPVGPDKWGMSNHDDLIAELMRHDLPEILGVKQSVWERRTHHQEKWAAHKQELKANIMDTVLAAEKKCLRSMDPALRDAVVAELMYHLPK